MRRVADGYRDVIGHAVSLLPDGIAQRVEHVDYLCDVDPVFAGVSRVPNPNPGWVARCTYAHSQMHLPADRRRTTVWLGPLRLAPAEFWPLVVLHELGHVLHEVVGWRYWASPVTEYAKENRYEAFAEAFVLWVMGWQRMFDLALDSDWSSSPLYLRPDDVTVALFDSLT